ncbi:MAG: SH3 domain-containing protein [Succinivibrionaceae bacterium]
MAKTNYNKMSKPNENGNAIIGVDLAHESDVPVETQIVPETNKPIEKAPIQTGVVVNCAKLNIRKGPSTDSDIIGTLDAGTAVEIRETIGDFYRIGNSEIDEFCMAKYISIK